MSTASHPLARHLDAQAVWRSALDRQLGALGAALSARDLLDASDAAALASLQGRLRTDKLVLAFVAEFSRGKSELINALFFGDSGRRVLPATPGRTTMCPVELRWDAEMPARLSLLPIETRLQGATLAEWRGRCAAPGDDGPDPWQHQPLPTGDSEALAAALQAVTATRRVSREQAEALGLWQAGDADSADAAPPQHPDGGVEVPAWRHAVINHPHPLLERGLVVFDTPGLNAVGAEPELTLGLLPAAHAVVFVLAADAGVSRSDLALWREHLSVEGVEHFVVLNKVDALADPLLAPEQVRRQLAQQREQVAQLLGQPLEQVYPLSARGALAARLAGNANDLQASGLPPFEQALAARLLPGRQDRLAQGATRLIEQLRAASLKRLADRRRQHAEQLFELRGLRGKSSGKLRLLAARVDAEMAEFESCTARFSALRAVQQRMLRAMLAPLSSDALRVEVAAMHSAMGLRPLLLGARGAFEALFTRLRAALAEAARQADEMRQMMDASFTQLNSEFGFALALVPPPDLGEFDRALVRLQQGYGRYLGIGQVWRLATPGFGEQFRRMLLSRLRMSFESAASELEQWSKGAAAQVDAQVRERRRGFTRRREALERVQAASGELESRIADVQAQDEQCRALQEQLEAQADAALQAARALAAAASDGDAAAAGRQDAA